MTDESGPAIISQRILAAETLPNEAEQQRRRQIAETRDLEVFAPVELERVEGGNGLLVFVPDGTLWVQGTRHHVDVLGREKVRVVYEGDPLTPRFLIPANEAGGNAPATLAEWNEREARRTTAIERSRQEQEAKRKALRLTAEPVTFDALAGDGATLTLRQAAEKVEAAGGTIRVEDARLVVALPPSALHTMGLPSQAVKAAARLYKAEAEVVASAKRGGEVAASKLPDKAILPSGALAP